MDKRQSRVPLKQLNLSNRFLFAEVMEDEQTHRDILSIILEHEVPLLTRNETEKEGRISPLARSIRMDVYAVDEDNVVYNTEMQDRWRKDLIKRSRYYQSLIDAGLLEPGTADYNALNDSCIIMIATFDIFGYGKYRYTFRAKCEEEPGCVLKDGAVRIFLNTKGKNDSEVSEELIEFLHYVENSTDEVAERSESEHIRRLHERVCKVKSSEEVGVRYMQAWEEKYYEREEAREEGREEGRAEGICEGQRIKLKDLIVKKLEKGKSIEAIAEELEESEEIIRELIEEINTGV